MSLDATNWAWRADVDSPLQRVVLLTLADRANEEHTCYPSQKRIAKDTCANIKTVGKVLTELEEKSLIKWTGKIKGNGVKVYQLIGVNGRETEPSTTTKNGTSTKSGTCTKSGVGTSPKTGIATSPKSGVQNHPLNHPIESKNKKTWICFKKLREEISLIDTQIDFENLKNANWFEREKRAFEIYNAEKNLCDDLMIYHFADWLLNAKAKYEKSDSKQSEFKNQKSGLSEKQISAFAMKLANHSEFASAHAPAGWTLDRFTAWVAEKLAEPRYQKNWAVYLKQVGFTGVLAS